MTSAGHRQNASANYAGGVGMLTDVSAQARPITREGLGGMRVKTAGLGRRIQDSSYYLGVLRAKCREIKKEVSAINSEIRQAEKDSTKYTRMQTKYEELMTEVRELEGNLADYNLAMDKARTGTDPMEIERFKEALRERNRKTQREVDKIFLTRQREEARAKGLQSKIMDIHRSTDARVAQLAPQKLEKYKTLMSEDFALAKDVEQKSLTIAHLKSNISRIEDEIRKKSWRNEYLTADRKVAASKKEIEMLQQEFEALSMDPATAREHLLQKVKWTSNAIKEAEAKIEDLETANAKSKRTLEDLTSDIEDREGKSRDANKFEVLFKRDKEMSQFIDNFPEISRQQLEDQEKTRQMIAALLEHISEDLNRQSNIPSKTSVEDMRSDLSFKKRQVDASQSTQKRLEKELAKRSEELKKIDSVGAKIQKELSTLKTRMRNMKGSMDELSDIGKLKAEAQQTAEKLRDAVKVYEARRDGVRQQLPLVTRDYEAIKSALECETMGNLNAQEVRIRVNEQNIFKMTDFIKTRGHETQYESLKAQCTKALQNVNSAIIRIQNEFEESVIGGPGSYK